MEVGAWETLRNNLWELREEKVFKNLIRKLLQYALEHLGGEGTAGTARSLPSASYGVYAHETQDAIDAYWDDPAPENVPFRDLDEIGQGSGLRSAQSVNEAEIQADLENDGKLQASLLALAVNTQATTGDPITLAETVREIFSEGGEEQGDGRGLIEIYKVAKYLARALKCVISRHSTGRDHGLYATCVEEAIRGLIVLASPANEWAKALQWNRMKADTAEAFGDEPGVHAGTALLNGLKGAIAAGYQPKRITLVGHSTGAIYIANWLAKCADYLPSEVKQDVIFLAPAITYDLFSATLEKYGERIGRFRLFAMLDNLERDDQLWGSDEELQRGRDWRRFTIPHHSSIWFQGSLNQHNPTMAISSMSRICRLSGWSASIGIPPSIPTHHSLRSLRFVVGSAMIHACWYGRRRLSC